MVFAIEALTNPRLRNELGELQLVPPDERLSGAGSTPIMAAFTHLNPEGSRFSDGSYGVYYAAHDLDTAIAEVSHHRAIFLSRTQEPAIDIDLRLIARAAARPGCTTCAACAAAHRSSTTRSTTAPAARSAGSLREAGSWGVLYHSVRRRGGLCAGVFRPKALKPAREAAHIALHWDGSAHHALVREARSTRAGLSAGAMPAPGSGRQRPLKLGARFSTKATAAPL